MQNIFEDNIQKRLDDFKLEPSDQTWLEVEKALHPHHEKRGIFWWWMPLVGGIVAGLIIWIFYINKPALQKNVLLNKQIINNSSVSSTQDKNIKNKQAATQKSLTGLLISPAKKANEYYNENKTEQIAVTNHHAPKINANIKLNEQKLFLHGKNGQANTAQNAVTIKKGKIDTSYNSMPASTSGTGVNNENKKTNKTSIQKTNSSVSPIKQTTGTAKNKNNKKGKWFIVGEAGLLNTGTKVLSNSSNKVLSDPASNYQGMSNYSSQIYTTKINTGIEFALGIHHQIPISKHWNFETGLMYRYFQNEQSVENTFNAQFLSTSLIANYYSPQLSNPVKVTNYAHSIQIPLLLNYTINPKQKNKFYLQGGIEAGYLFAKKWLIVDEDLNTYYYRSSLLNSFQLSPLLGIGINFNNRLQTNINFRQSVIPLYKINDNKIYTNQFSLQVFIPVNIKSKK